MPEKILFYSPNFHWGGAVKIIIPLINNLNSSKYKKSFIVNFDTGELKNLLANDIEVLEPLMTPKLKLSFQLPYAIYKLSRIIEHYNIVVCCLEMSTDYMGILARMLSFKKPKIITFIITDVFKFVNEYPQRKFELIMTKRLLRYADRVIFFCKLMEQSLKNKLQIKKSSVLYPPIEREEIIRLSKEEVDLNLRPDEKIFISCGRFILPKRFDLIIRAFYHLKDTPCKLLLVGDGPLKNELVNLTRRLGLENRVYFIPYTSNPYKYIARSYAYILASNYEGFGIVMLESFALGKPVITTPTYFGPMDLIKNNHNGLIADDFTPQNLAKKIRKLITDDILYHKLCENALHSSYYFDAQNILKQFEDIITDVLHEIEK